MARAVLWGPAGGASPPEPLGQLYPVFLHQQALRQIILHTRAAPTKALLGFLLGELCQCPETGIRYALIDQGLRVGAEVPGDHTSALLAKVWPRLQENIATLKRQVIGWYHSHPTGSTAFSREDIGTQLMYFAQAWQVGLVLGTEEGKPGAGWFRVSQSETWATVRLPFYEVLSPDSIDGTGKKRSHVDWGNFKPYKAVAPPARKAAAPAPRPSVTTAAPAVRGVGSPPRPGATTTQVAATPMPRPPAPPPRPAAPPPVPEPPRRAPTFTRAPSPPPVLEEEAEAEEPVAEEPVAAEPEAEEPAAEEPVAEEPVAEEPAREEEPAEEEPVEEEPEEAAPPPAPRPAPVPPSARVVRPSFSVMERHAEPAPKAAAGGRLWIGAGLGVGLMAVLVAAGWYLGFVQFGRPPQATSPQQAQSQAAAPTSAPATTPQRPPAQPAAPVAPQVNPALVALDRLADSVLTAVRTYRQRGTAFDQGQRDCAPLSQALVSVEALWISYNQRKQGNVTLDAPRAARDQSLYAQVDTVESHFDTSACPRP